MNPDRKKLRKHLSSPIKFAQNLLKSSIIFINTLTEDTNRTTGAKSRAIECLDQ